MYDPPSSDGDVAEWSSSSEDIPVYISHTAEIYYSEGLEQSVSETGVKDLNLTSIC